MKQSIRLNHWKILQVFAVLILTGLACNLGRSPEVIPTPIPPTEVPIEIQPTPVDTQAPEDTGSGPEIIPNGLSRSQRQQLAASTVLILMADINNGRIQPFGIGSGTIISADGLILTNAHVAQPSAGGFGQDPEVLVIAMNESESKPPIWTYIAEVQAVDGELDLAVIRITSNLDGSFVNSNSLDLPFVEIGDSDDMLLGDNVYIFGFPGIGGETITFTKGSVSGFTTENPVGDRAWIKTDATIAGGNSGGLGANDFGQIIGIPTRGGSGANVDIADCRVVQDTNGDGRADANDTCIPIGGFINALRPVNLAIPLVRAAQTGTAYESPYGVGSVNIPSSGSEQFGFLTWSTYFDEDTGCATDPGGAFTSGIDQLTAVFNFDGMTDGQGFALYWLIDGETVVEDFFPWEYGSAGDCFPFFIHNGGEALPDGRYTLLLTTGDGRNQVAEVSTTIGNAAASSNLVTLDGYVYDTDTGNAVSDAVIVVLEPGLDPDEWLDSGSEDQVLVWTSTDSAGYFQLPIGLERGVDYPAVAGASSQGYISSTGYIYFEDNDPDVVTIEIGITR